MDRPTINMPHSPQPAGVGRGPSPRRARVVTPPPTPMGIAEELQRQRARHKGWKSISMMESASKPRAADAFAGVSSRIAGASSWIVAFLAGLALGVIAVMVEACTRFVISFRIGICEGYFWLGPSLCCAYTEEEDCEAFKTWGVFFGGENGRHAPMLDFLFYVFWAAVFACTAAFLCKTYSPFAAGGGIIEVKTTVAGAIQDQYLGLTTLVVKAVGVCMSTGSSFVVGKEGPFVHIGSCVADIVAQRVGITDDNQRRELIAAGAAGGVAVAFGAPIGGVIFAIEEISGAFRYRSMMQSLIVGTIAVLVVKAVDMFHTGRIVQFSINYKHQWHWFEIGLFILIGSLGGMFGAIFNRGNQAWCARRKRLWQRWKVTEIFVVVIISAVLHYNTPFLKGGMLELLADLYQDCAGNDVEICKAPEFDVMLYSIIGGTIKLGLAIISVGAFVPAGLLVPSLAIGALYGRAFGIFINALTVEYNDFFLFTECSGHSVCVLPGVYAIVGSAAVLCGVTRMTICLAVIMFELTGGLEYLVPVVFALLAAKATAGTIFKVPSIYDIGIEANGLPILEAHLTWEGAEPISVVYKNQELTVLERYETLESLSRKVRVPHNKKAPTGYPVVDTIENNRFIGYVEREGLEEQLKEIPVSFSKRSRIWFGRSAYDGDAVDDNIPLDMSPIVQRPPITIHPDEPLSRVLGVFHNLHPERLIIVRDLVFDGIVTRTDLLTYIRKHGHHH